MKQTRTLMGMHITIDVVDRQVRPEHLDAVFAYFRSIDDKFSTYKEASEISQINNGLLRRPQYSADMKLVLSLCEQTRQETNGYFDINHHGKLDPSGLVKGWSIWRAANLLRRRGFENFYVDAGGDIQVAGRNPDGQPWTVGIRNPFDDRQIVKVLAMDDRGIATSGTACRGQHIYNPHHPDAPLDDIVSLSVIGPNVYEADRFATAAFAMGPEGIHFIEALDGFEAYMINRAGIATSTSGFDRYVASPAQPAQPEPVLSGGHVTP